MTSDPLCEGKVPDGGPCGSVVTDPQAMDEVQRRLCPWHANGVVEYLNGLTREPDREPVIFQ